MMQSARLVDDDAFVDDDGEDAGELVSAGDALKQYEESLREQKREHVERYLGRLDRHVHSPAYVTADENALIASVLAQPDLLDALPIVLTGDDFARDQTRLLWGAIQAVRARGHHVSTSEVTRELMRRAQVDAAGGDLAIQALAAGERRPYEVPYIARRIREAARLRAIQTICNAGYTRAHVVDGDSTAIATELVTRLERALSDTSVSTHADMRETADAVLDEITAISGKVRPMLSTGFRGIDEVLGGGAEPGSLILIAARPSVGKTSLGLDFVRNISVRRGIPGAVFSLEMNRKQLVHKLIAGDSGVNTRLPMMSTSQRERILLSKDRVATAPIYLDDTPAVAIGALRAKLRQLVKRHGVQYALIDYIQLADGDDARAKQFETISAISRGLKLAAAELHIPIFAISQLNRENEKRASKRPELADLRGSGALEQDADVIALLHRDGRYLRDVVAADRYESADLDIAKNRLGPVQVLKLRFEGALTRFSDPE